MESLDYAEKRSAAALDAVRKIYETLHERAYKLTTALVAGGGAVSAYVWGQIAVGAALIAWVPLAALALCWFACAAYLVWVALRGSPMSSIVDAAEILRYHDEWEQFDKQNPQRAMQEIKKDALRHDSLSIKNYSDGCNSRSAAIDAAYKAIVLASPIVPTVAAICVLQLNQW